MAQTEQPPRKQGQVIRNQHSNNQSMDVQFFGAIDQGTTSTRFMVYDSRDLSKDFRHARAAHKQFYPKEGWVEHCAMEIWMNVRRCLEDGLSDEKVREQCLGIGITNQRETTVVWDRTSGKPLHPAIVWNDGRTQDLVNELNGQDKFVEVKKRCGLPVSTYFSGVKLLWLLNNVEDVQKAVQDDRAMFGTIDSWLIWNLTGGINGGKHVTDVTNASRTMLMNLETLKWDPFLFNALGIPFQKGLRFPDIRSSSEIYGYLEFDDKYKHIPISGCAGDQQAALIGQRCFQKGEAKNTYGTGCFMLLNTGEDLVPSKQGLLTTVAYQIGTNSKPVYALEGSVASGGASIEWCRDQMGLFETFEEFGTLTESVENSGGVYFVPAFSGLLAPHWKPEARGCIVGMTYYTSKAHILRALLDSIAFQSQEVLQCMQKDSGIEMSVLKVDGGVTNSKVLMQLQSDILGSPVVRSNNAELTVVGAAICAGLGVKYWKSFDELPTEGLKYTKFQPTMNESKRKELEMQWKNALQKSF